MTGSINIYDYVVARLAAKDIPRKEVARLSGVPFSTVSKIATCEIENPSVHSVQKLFDFFSSRPIGASGVAEDV